MPRLLNNSGGKMAAFESLNSLVMIFIMIIPGIIAAKTNIITEDQDRCVSTIVVNITFPCLVVDAMQVAFSKQMLLDAGYLFLIMIAVFVVALLIGIALTKVIKMSKAHSYIFTFMLVFGNTGFMGLPIVNAIYGREGMFYASILEMVNDILMFTVGIMLIQAASGGKLKMELKGLLSPGFISVIIGVTFFLTGFILPEFIGDCVSIIGAATTPLSMIAIGLQLGRMHIKEIVGDYTMYILSFLRLILIPAVLLAALLLFGGELSLLTKVVILEIAMPVAACSTLFSQQYKADAAYATKGVMLSTVLSILTLSMFVLLLGNLT